MIGYLALSLAMSAGGWAWLTPFPLAWALSQVPVAVWLLAWLVDRAGLVDWTWRPLRSRRATQPAPQPAEAADLPAPVSLAEHRDRRVA